MTRRGSNRPLAPLDALFGARGLRPFPFQRDAWQAFFDGDDALIHAPTGTGKTWAAAGGPLALAVQRAKLSAGATVAGAAPKGSRKEAPRALRLLWITPLRALSADTRRALEAAAEGLGLDWRVLARTGDSSNAERRAVQLQRVDALVTTPESLALMLSYSDAADRFAALDAVVVDEWHELLGSKRGTLLELDLARLRTLVAARPKRLVTLGLSATLSNLDEALAALTGDSPRARIVAGRIDKPLAVASLLPDSAARFPWAGHLGLVQLHAVKRAIDAARTTLLFTNTRSQAELWHRALSSVWTDAPETLGLHHGSIAREERARVEDALAAGAIRAVVATSSLDLGVDFAEVDQVIQIGSPKGVSRLIQRAGRSGHRPDLTSRLLLVPTHTLELIDLAAVRRALAAGHIEPRRPLEGRADVLAQHLTSIALAGGFDADAMYAEVRRAYAYRKLDRALFDAVVQLITYGGRALSGYPDFQKVVERDGRFVVESKRVARLHRLSLGTIVSDGTLAVRLMRGASLGQLEESFLARLKPGDRFTFSGRALELVRIKDLTAYVRPAKSQHAIVARWVGSKMPLTHELSQAIRALLGERDAPEREMRLAEPMLAAQRALSHVPAADELLVERIRARDGEHLFVYPIEGRPVHEGLAALIAARLGRLASASFSYAMSDFGFVVGAAALPPLDAATVRALFAVEDLDRDLAASVNLGELARRQFREIARVAGFIFQGVPGRPKSMKQLTASSTLIYDVLSAHEPDHVLLQQSIDEVMARELELSRLKQTLVDITARKLVFTTPMRLTPFAFPLWADSIRGHLSNEDWQARVTRMAGQLEAAA